MAAEMRQLPSAENVPQQRFVPFGQKLRGEDYAAAALRGQHMQLGFLQHSLMISRMHFMIEMACRKPNHPLVSGPAKRAGLFWFTISPLFTDRTPTSGAAPECPLPQYLRQPEIIMDRIWALPDRSILALGDAENSGSTPV